jgi:predicted nucleotidyltransferase
VGLFTTLTLWIVTKYEMKWQLEREARDAAAGVVRSAHTTLGDVGLQSPSGPGTSSSGH